MRKLLVLLLILLVTGAGGRAWADSAPMATVGPHLQPMESTTVRLESERIDIHLRRAPAREPYSFSYTGVADYRIRFHFVPTADEAMTLGFPLFVIDSDQHIYGARLENFQVMQGEREVATETQTGLFKDWNTEWAVFPLTFRKGEPLDLVITYSLPAVPRGKTYAADMWIAYVLRTGALWAGTIGKAEAHLTMDRPIRQEDIRALGPDRLGTTPGWKLEGGALHWEWREVEPDFDLSLQVANTYWLDLPDDIQALLAGGTPDRERLQRITMGTISLLEGNGRTGHWDPVRGGLSGEVAEKFLPDVMRLLTEQIRKNPKDWQMRELYLRLLYHSAWRWTDQGLALYNESRFRTHMAEYRQLRKDGGAYHPVSIFPWAGGGLPGVHLSDAAQAEAVAVLIDEEMPPAFPHADGARAWVTQAAGGAWPVLNAGYAEALAAEALKRVKPPEPVVAAPAAPAPEPAPVAPPSPPASEPAPAAGFPWIPVGAAALVLVLGGGVFLARRR